MIEQAPQAQRPGWVRLDNAANIFVAARSEVDTKVFRLSAELDEDIDSAVLQQALDRVYAQYPLFRAVLRRGIFWYYLQQSELQPEVRFDDGPSVPHLYQDERRDLLFRVLHRGRRISLEVFHALTDGTGALWFFQDLLTEYVGLRHLDEFEAAAPGPVKQDFAPDAFTHWFRTGGSATFAEDATSAVQSPTTRLPEGVRDPGEASARTGRKKRARSDVLRVGGTHTPDNRTRVVELSMPVRPVLALARAEHVSLTIYLLAVFFDALRQTRLPAHGRPRTLTCSVPVNLRQFFPTESGRNFFATTMLEHTYGEGDRTAGAGEGPAGGGGADSIGSVCRSLHEQFQQVVSREGLERKIRRLVRFERNPALRVIPRPAKDLILGTINRWQNLGTTVAISNMGRVELPEPADPHVGRIFLHVSAVRPQFCVVSHGDHLTISFTSPFVETDVHAAFVRTLTEVGVPVEIDVSRVTADEIAAVVEPGTGT